jgi:Kef-type K+ transport system membrane component KefB
MLDFMTHLPMLTSFALTLMLTLVLPNLMERLRLPRPIGYIAAGIILGPNVFAVLNPEGKTVGFFAELGKLLLMFFAGFDVDIEKFRKAKNKAAIYGLLTFGSPFALATIIGIAAGYSPNACLVIGAILASHTLLGLPILKERGLLNREPVVVTVGATVFTDMLSILVLALCLPIHLNGFDPTKVGITLGWLAIYVPGVIFGLGWVAGRLLRIFGATKTSSSLIMLMVMAIAAQVAEWIGMEGIIGAFLAGVALKRAFDQLKGDDALEVMSQALFIPFFFVSAGFLVDFKVAYATMHERPLLVIGVVLALFGGKWVAAEVGGRIFGYSRSERDLMFSLTVPQVAATLAVALVAYSAVSASGQRLIDEPMLNATIVLVIVSSLTGLILTERAVKRLEKEAESSEGPERLRTSRDPNLVVR